jgi:hypothetical protein
VRLLSILLGIFLSIVLLLGILPSDPEMRLGLLQLWLLSPIMLAGGCGLALLFPATISRMAKIVRIAAPAVAVVAAFRGAWAHVPALLVLGLVFHLVQWWAKEVAAGRGLSGALRDALYLFQDLADRGRGRPPGSRQRPASDLQDEHPPEG